MYISANEHYLKGMAPCIPLHMLFKMQQIIYQHDKSEYDMKKSHHGKDIEELPRVKM